MVFRRRHDQRSDRARAIDQHGPAPQVSGAVYGVQGHGEGFGEGAVLRGHPFGQRPYLRRTDHAVLAEPAVGVRVEGGRPEVPDTPVEVGAAGDPVGQPFVPDRLRRVDGHRLPFRQTADTRAESGDPAGDLVSEHQRVAERGGPGGAVLPVRDIGAADPAPLHGDEDFSRARHRTSALVDPQIARTMDDNGPHTASSSRTRSRPRVSGARNAETRVMSE